VDLRQHFDQAVSDDPGADPAEMAHTAIAQGGRIRRRRTMAIAAAATVLAAAAGVISVAGRTDPPVTVAAAMVPVAAPSCSAKPVKKDATDVTIFLDPAATEPQLSAVARALHADARVGALQFEDREQAFQRFKARWASNPDLVKAVGATQLPESFRLRMTDPAQYTALRTTYATMAGVDQIVGRKCPVSAPVGGLQ
jgi:hypothetical protein